MPALTDRPADAPAASSPGHPLAGGLAAALGLSGPEAVGGVKRLSGGASQETWAFQVQPSGAALDAPPARYVLRRAPPGVVKADNGHVSLSDEAAIVAAVAANGVPVPAVAALLQPAHGLGQGFISQWVDGETLGGRIAAAQRPQLAWDCGHALARIHGCPRNALPGGLRQSQPGAEVAHLRRWHGRHGTVRPVFQLAFRWLSERVPDDGPQTLVHGDFRNGNLMVDLQAAAPDGSQGRLAAVLDWELACLGDPMADLGWMLVNAWRFGQIDRPVGGFAGLAPFFDGYVAGGGRLDEARVRWWQVLGTLRWGIICEGMGHAWITGAEPILDKAAIGRRASETDIDLLMLLAPPGSAVPA